MSQFAKPFCARWLLHPSTTDLQQLILIEGSDEDKLTDRQTNKKNRLIQLIQSSTFLVYLVGLHFSGHVTEEESVLL